MPKTCVLCDSEIQPHLTPDGVPYWWEGHNAAPVELGRCCDTCNDTIVIPTRIKLGTKMYFTFSKRRTEIVEEEADG